MIVTSVQIKTAKTQKHLYCLVFTKILHLRAGFLFYFLLTPNGFSALFVFFVQKYDKICSFFHI